MEDNLYSKKKILSQILSYKNGKIYFSRKTERKVFFLLTIIMLLWGVFTKLNLL